MKKVALIQDESEFSSEVIYKYMGNIQTLDSSNIIIIYKFIIYNICKNGIYKYVLYVNSKTLDEFIDYISIKKSNSCKICKLLNKCTFIASNSNANSVRKKNIIKKTNIYFSLSPISDVIQIFDGANPGKYMLIVSDTNTPYYNQIYNADIIPKYRISDPNLTVSTINNFNINGGWIIASLNTTEEYTKFTDLILQSDWRKGIMVIEISNSGIDIISKLKNKVAGIELSSSGVSLSGDIFYYKELNSKILYENCATILVNTYKLWNEYKKNKIISIEPSDHLLTWSILK